MLLHPINRRCSRSARIISVGSGWCAAVKNAAIQGSVSASSIHELRSHTNNFRRLLVVASSARDDKIPSYADRRQTDLKRVSVTNAEECRTSVCRGLYSLLPILATLRRQGKRAFLSNSLTDAFYGLPLTVVPPAMHPIHSP
jgi:hypothetical protein